MQVVELVLHLAQLVVQVLKHRLGRFGHCLLMVAQDGYLPIGRIVSDDLVLDGQPLQRLH